MQRDFVDAKKKIANITNWRPGMFRKITHEEAQKNMEERGNKIDAKQKLQMRMAQILANADEDQFNDWERGFIIDVYRKLQTAIPYLTDKQDETLTRLFERMK